jgi:hypothetical protein
VDAMVLQKPQPTKQRQNNLGQNDLILIRMTSYNTKEFKTKSQKH